MGLPCGTNCCDHVLLFWYKSVLMLVLVPEKSAKSLSTTSWIFKALAGATSRGAIEKPMHRLRIGKLYPRMLLMVGCLYISSLATLPALSASLQNMFQFMPVRALSSRSFLYQQQRGRFPRAGLSATPPR